MHRKSWTILPLKPSRLSSIHRFFYPKQATQNYPLLGVIYPEKKRRRFPAKALDALGFFHERQNHLF
jgi:hypothetical protein